VTFFVHLSNCAELGAHVPGRCPFPDLALSAQWPANGRSLTTYLLPSAANAKSRTYTGLAVFQKVLHGHIYLVSRRQDNIFRVYWRDEGHKITYIRSLLVSFASINIPF
jgi:hypothetical protein